jgi:hypothetical protein
MVNITRRVRWELAALVGLLFALASVPAARADAVVHVWIFDASNGYTEVTAAPASLINGHSYWIMAQNMATSAPGSGRLELDLGALSPYWTVTGQSHIDFHSVGSVSCSWSGTKYSCIATAPDTISQVLVTVNAVGATVVQTMVGRSASPTGLDTRQYTIN